jgi:hypothetical protein
LTKSTIQEKTFLVHLLEQTLGDLRQEVRHTDNFEFRAGLKKDESVVRHLINLFQSLPA